MLSAFLNLYQERLTITNLLLIFQSTKKKKLKFLLKSIKVSLGYKERWKIERADAWMDSFKAIRNRFHHGDHVCRRFRQVPGNVRGRSSADRCGDMQHRVISQPADDIGSKSDGSRDEVMTREQAVPYNDVRDAGQLLPVFKYSPETLCCLVVAILLHMLKIERSAASRGERKRLHREKEPALLTPARTCAKPRISRPRFTDPVHPDQYRSRPGATCWICPGSYGQGRSHFHVRHLQGACLC